MKNSKYLINSNEAIKKALKQINNLPIKNIFVIENGVLLGSLSDGDIRRYFLRGGEINDCVSKACNVKCKKASTDLEASKIISENYKAIPIVDECNRIIKVYTGQKKITRKMSIPIVINAGGKGTRLEPYTKVLPKPLIPVGDYPIIEQIMRRYESFGCSQFHIIVNYKKQLIKAYFSDTNKKYNITWYDEDKALGTGGGLYLVKNKIKETFIFSSCDNLLLCDYKELLNKHKKEKNEITMVCVKKKTLIPYGVVSVENDKYSRIIEKPNNEYLVNSGIYVVEPSVLNTIKKNTKIDFPSIIENVKNSNNRIGVFVVEENEWFDVGDLDNLENTKKYLMESKYGK